MPQTVEVRFKGIRRDFFHWPDDRDPLRPREAVVVQAERGQDLGRVHTTDATAEKKCGGCTGCATDLPAPPAAEGAVEASVENAPAADGPAVDPIGSESREDRTGDEGTPAAEAPASNPSPARPSTALRPVLRRATPDEVAVADNLRRSEDDARRRAMEKVQQHRLEMKVSDAEWQWDKGKLTLYFTAEKRVDFRALVRDLAAVFRTRIELRQIGVRDEAARLTGVGRCGREYCCSTWLKELSPVSLALAKDQHLSLNPAQISGGCGRLLCCLKYEHEFYVASRKRFPREGKTVTTARGTEKVIAVDIFRERVFLRNDDGSRIIPLLQLREEETLAGEGQVAPPVAVPPPRPPAREEPRRPPVAARPTQSPEPPAPRPPESPAPRPAGQSRRRRRRGRRGGRGPHGGPGGPPPSGPPEA